MEVTSMNNFKTQLLEDIDHIQKYYGYLDNKLNRKEFAFNYWILSKLYSLDEEVVWSNITEGNDKSIDCFVHYEDTKELFLIQNKFYDEGTIISREKVSDFLETPLNTLISGNYRRSIELQKIFDRIRDDSEYKIWLHFYTSNNYVSNDIQNMFSNFSHTKKGVSAFIGAKYNTLEDIKSLYFDDRFTEKKSFTADLPTRVKATSLDVRPESYELNWMIDLRYVMVNVVDLYKLYKKALDKNYELFEANVREYLGTRGINNGIIKTLRSTKDRENFFYYNNGITIICQDCKTLSAGEIKGGNYGFRLQNPQIVNGCQTVNSIAEVLSHYSEDRLTKEFSKVFVLVKVFVFDEKTKKDKPDLDSNIVKYTNSQNGINDKAFASKHNYFKYIQSEFLTRGTLLLVKPSDKNKFNVKYADLNEFAKLKTRSQELYDFFELDNNKMANYMFQLEKMLKVFLAFVQDGAVAFKKGGTVLKPASKMYKEFSLNISNYFTIDNMVRLYLWYVKAEIDKKENDNRVPTPYYLFGFLGKQFKNKDFKEVNSALNELFSNKDTFKLIYDFYKAVIELYIEEYCEKYDVDYNIMIKQPIDEVIVDKCIKNMMKFRCPNEVKEFLDV